jgi:hypothetical protein
LFALSPFRAFVIGCLLAQAATTLGAAWRRERGLALMIICTFLVEGIEETKEALGGELTEAPTEQFRDLGLVDAE